MAENTPENLDEKIKAAQAEAANKPNAADAVHGKEEKKAATTLDSFVNETSHAAKNIAGAGLAAGFPLALGSVLPSMQRDAAVVAGGFSLGKIYDNYKTGRKTTIGDIVNESAVAALITPPLNLGYQVMNAISNPVMRGFAYLVPYQLAFVPFYLGMDYLVKKRTFKGLYSEGIKPNVKQVIKDNWLYLGLPGLLNLFFTPAYLQVPVVVGLAFLFRLISSKKKKGDIPESEKRDNTPYSVAAPNVSYKLVRNTSKGLYEAVSAVGSGLGSLLYSPSKKIESKPAAPPAEALPKAA